MSENPYQSPRPPGSPAIPGIEPFASLEPPLVFEGRLNIDDAVHVRRYCDLLLLGRPVRWLIGIVIAPLWVMCGWTILERGPQAGLVGLVIVFSYLLILPWIREQAARRHYRRQEAEYLETRVSLTTDRVAIENQSQRSEFAWKHVGVVADTPHGILFCNRMRQALFWLPERLFEGNRFRDRVLDLAVLHEVPVRRLR